MVDFNNGVAVPGGGSFIPPDLGLDKKLPALIDAYWSGLDQAYKQRNQNAFKEGIPKDASGNPDYNAILERTLTAGGTPQTQAAIGLAGVDLNRRLLDLGQKQTELIARTEGLGGNPAPLAGQPTVAPTANAGTRPTAAPAGAPMGGAAPVPGPATVPNGDNGKNTVTSLISSRMPAELAGPAINGVSAMLGVDPNAPIDTNDPVFRQRFADAFRKYQGGDASAAAAPQPTPAASVADRFPTAQGRGSPPTGPDPEIQKKIALYTALAASPNPQVAAAAKARLADLQKSVEPTTEAKNYDLARRQGYTGTFQDFQAQSKADEAFATESTKGYVKKYETINTAGERSRQEVPQLQLARSLMDDPNFYSGTGEKYNLLYKRILSAIGSDPNVAAPQEAFRKVVSNSILDSIKSLAGTGQIRVAEINLMKEAAASPENTPAANKVLLEIATRLNQRNVAIADMAENYRGGRLDAGFDRMVTAYDKAHPLFAPGEAENFRKIINPSGGKPGATKLTTAEVSESLANARAALKANPGARGAIIERLRGAGIDPSAL